MDIEGAALRHGAVLSSVEGGTMVRATRKTVSWARKIFHLMMIGGVGLTTSFAAVTHTQALLIAAVAAVLVGGADLLRLAVPSLNARVLRDFSAIIRVEEKNAIAASTWFVIGVLLTIAIAPLPLAGLAFLYLAAGDPIASWVGVRFGKTKLPGGKSLEGSLALVITCALVGGLFLALTGTVPVAAAPIVAVGGALAAALAEWLPLKWIDDNFRVPVCAAAALEGLALATAR